MPAVEKLVAKKIVRIAVVDVAAAVTAVTAAVDFVVTAVTAAVTVVPGLDCPPSWWCVNQNTASKQKQTKKKKGGEGENARATNKRNQLHRGHSSCRSAQRNQSSPGATLELCLDAVALVCLF